jgi:protein Tex
MNETFDPSPQIAAALTLSLASVKAVVALLAEGATVPFIARYRKEHTGGLDEVAIRAIEVKREYYTDLHERRTSILKEIEGQGKLTAQLRAQIEACTSKSALEDIYLPFRPKRRTRAKIARERGLEPLAQLLLSQPKTGNVMQAASSFVDLAKEVPNVESALAGARDIVAEVLAERPKIRALVRDAFQKHGIMTCTPTAKNKKTPAESKFEMYYDFQEPVRTLPSHRYLAINRGETEGILRASVAVDHDSLSQQICEHVPVSGQSPFASELRSAVSDSLTRLLAPSIESDVRSALKDAADIEAIRIFAENLQKVLLQPALGRQTVIGIDPGQRTGCKCVVVDDTGKFLHHTVINLVLGESAIAHAKKTISELIAKYKPFAIAVGNGTHGRETADLCRAVSRSGCTPAVAVVMVNESGASVYSASDIAREEFPNLDLTIRGAISIARRLQDPLAELVKLDPKVIGVGQYQHDVDQPLLKKKLSEVVVSCVTSVGVELNTASAELLTHVAGVGASLAKKVVSYRDKHGAFASRKALLDVPGLGPKAFEQCAGFVRVENSTNPLDASAVHPERYALLTKIAKDARVHVQELMGNPSLIKQIPWATYVANDIGMPTLQDIQNELLRPGRDPRAKFEAPAFRDDIRTLEDLKPGMQLEGVVTNVTAFGAFVDLGVHQDGLVHVSQLADRFVTDPHACVKVGDRLNVRVVSVDMERKRIALTAKSGAIEFAQSQARGSDSRRGAPQAKAQPRAKKSRMGAFATTHFRNYRASKATKC